jgi:hypothetical protein
MRSGVSSSQAISAENCKAPAHLFLMSNCIAPLPPKPPRRLSGGQNTENFPRCKGKNSDRMPRDGGIFNLRLEGGYAL